ncbi:hypothetical protein ACFQ07_04150, partial [Actinomadura adrarensis]
MPLAERCALLSRRDDDFVMVVLTAYAGMRWGEVLGLERPACRLDRIQIDWQLRELRGKDDSYRHVDLPTVPDGAGVGAERPDPRSVLLHRACPGVRRDGSVPVSHPERGHHRWSTYARRVFQPAADGRYPRGVR